MYKGETMSEIEYGIIITQDEDGFYAEVPDLDGCSTSGDTFEEVLQNIREAISSYIGSMRKHGETPPTPTFKVVPLSTGHIFTQIRVAA